MLAKLAARQEAAGWSRVRSSVRPSRCPARARRRCPSGRPGGSRRAPGAGEDRCRAGFGTQFHLGRYRDVERSPRCSARPGKEIEAEAALLIPAAKVRRVSDVVVRNPFRHGSLVERRAARRRTRPLAGRTSEQHGLFGSSRSARRPRQAEFLACAWNAPAPGSQPMPPSPIEQSFSSVSMMIATSESGRRKAARCASSVLVYVLRRPRCCSSDRG